MSETKKLKGDIIPYSNTALVSSLGNHTKNFYKAIYINYKITMVIDQYAVTETKSGGYKSRPRILWLTCIDSIFRGVCFFTLFRNLPMTGIGQPQKIEQGLFSISVEG